VNEGQRRSLEVLDADGYVKLHRTMGTGVASMSGFSLTTPGLGSYASTFIEDYTPMAYGRSSTQKGHDHHGRQEQIATACAAAGDPP
jgi:hypothetical protein